MLLMLKMLLLFMLPIGLGGRSGARIIGHEVSTWTGDELTGVYSLGQFRAGDILSLTGVYSLGQFRAWNILAQARISRLDALSITLLLFEAVSAPEYRCALLLLLVAVSFWNWLWTTDNCGGLLLLEVVKG